MDALDQAAAIARSIALPVEHAFQLPGGNQNHVVRIVGGGRDVVVRFARSPQRMPDLFDVEAWCLAAARRVDLPSSQLVRRGRLSGVSFLIVEYVEGETASPSDFSAWEAIGQFAAALTRIDVSTAPELLFSRFGRSLDVAWDAHIAYNLAALAEGDSLMRLRVYDPADRSRLGEMLQRLRRRKLTHGLVHGDLSTRNLVRGAGYTLIDWGAAHVGPTPWADLEQINRWRILRDDESPVSVEAWQRVLESTGLDAAQAQPVVDELAVLHALDVVRWAIDRRPDRLDDLVTRSRHVLRETLH